jgi:hypothetical protein
MFKKTSRCSMLMLLMVGVITLGFSSIANAQLHGATILKGCDSPIRACDDDADCADDNECITNTCNDVTWPDNTVSCTIEITNSDGHFDTLSINSVEDVLATSGGDVTTPSTAMTISVSGGATCAAGNTLPCILPRTPLESGQITLDFGGYNPVLADVPSISDQATAKYFDLCNAPATSGCDPVTNQTLQAGASVTVADACEEDPLDCPPDNDLCTTDFECDPAVGCPPPEDIVCDPDNDLCTNDFLCDTDTGLCPPPEDIVCDPDNDLCTTDYECDTDTGLCPPPSDPKICDPREDGVICDLCDSGTGECIAEVPVPDRCLPPGNERCRTPGFWGARGGIEKAPKSQNITQAVIDQAILENGFGLPVCGIYIDNTDLLSNFSAIEAMCVSVKGVTERQLVRQLTAAALNCVLGDCNVAHTAMLAGCNTVCDTGVGDAGMCIDALDCFNNGGDWDGTMCTTGAGYCEIGGEACDDVNTCVGLGDSCLPGDSCHDRDLCPDFDDDGAINGSDFCFEPPGPASSPRKCNAARKNDVYVP